MWGASYKPTTTNTVLEEISENQDGIGGTPRIITSVQGAVSGNFKSIKVMDECILADLHEDGLPIMSTSFFDGQVFYQSDLIEPAKGKAFTTVHVLTGRVRVK